MRAARATRRGLFSDGILRVVLGALLLAVALAVATREGVTPLVSGLTTICIAVGVALMAQAALARRRADEAELARLSWRLNFALSASRIGVWDVDLATDQLIWDDQARDVLGITEVKPFYREEDWLAALHPDDRDRALAEANAAVDRDGEYRCEYRVMGADGTVRNIRDSARVYVGEDGSRRLVGLVQDITADVQRERELQEQRLEAEAATRAKSRFLATMSHEIRTPMSGVLGLLGLMLGGRLEAEQREQARLALDSAEQLLAILNDILDFSRLEAQSLRIVPEPVALGPLFAEVSTLMGAAACSRGLRLRLELDPRLPEAVLADPQRLRQVVVNLVNNAIKFTREGGVDIAVGYRPAAAELAVSVTDTGIGVDPEQVERIFEHFVQGDDSYTRKAGGTGLGLAICRQLVELMGGRLTVASRPGGGSVFAFTARAPVAAAAPAGTPAAADGEGSSATGSMRLLLAEDNSTNQYVIGALLRAGGHSVETVADGREAVAAAAAGGFDAVLMDVHMPGMDGLTAAGAIRALTGPAARVPIIALTANAMTGDREACIAAGMSDFVTKPVEVAALSAALRRVQAG